LESVLLDVKGSLVPFFISSVHIKGNKATLSFEDMTTLEEAREIIGLTMFLPLKTLPKLDNGQFYFHEVIGYSVINNGSAIGQIENFNTGSAQTIIIVKQDSKEILIPMVDDFMGTIDHELKTFNVALPNGLIELYLEDTDG
jgi:16S rRNA processing protein RimM